MQASAWNKKRIALVRMKAMDVFRGATLGDCFFKRLAGRARPQSGKNFRAGLGVGDVPHFGLGLAPERLCDRGRRMHLQRKCVVRVEQL